MKIMPEQKLVLLYALFSGIYIIYSDRILLLFFSESVQITQYQTYKGWAFVLITSVLLYFVLAREFGMRRQTKAILRKEKGFISAVLDTAAVLICVTDSSDRIVVFNKACEEITGLRQEDVIGLNYKKILFPGGETGAPGRGDDEYPAGEYFESELISGQGEKRMVTWIKRVMQEPGMEAPLVICSGVDITERKHTEEELAAEKERLAVTLRSIGDGVITTDINGRVLLINRVAEKLSGWSNHESVGRYLHEVFPIIDEKTRRPCASPVDRVLQTQGIINLVDYTVLVARDGSERIISDSCAPIFDTKSKIIGVVLVFRDITEERKVKEEIARMNKLDSISTLAGGIAHDFNNALTAIMGNVSLAKGYARGQEDLIEILADVEKATLRARNLTNQLLTFARGGVPVKSPTSLAAFIKESVHFALRGSNISCDYIFPDNLNTVEIDVGQMSQVLNNLVINAQQALAEGGRIRIICENVKVDEELGLPLKKGDYVKISVEDEGEGISEEIQDKIFDPFFTTKEGGHGLGLATTYSIILKHDGYINVRSKSGKGSIFNIYLPASGKAAGVEGAPKSFVNTFGKILIMDDEEQVRKAVGRMLNFVGYEVDYARDGREAIQKYMQSRQAGTPFDVLIMDLTIQGGMGGKEAMKRLIEMDPLVKAVVSSGYSNDPVMSDYKNYGFSGVVAKPYKMEVLIETLHRLMGAKSDSSCL